MSERANLLSILHISDLHRSASDPVENNEVITALLSDRDRYVSQAPPITPPNAIIVSGDIIQGVALGDTSFCTTLSEQYRQASHLLSDICNRFVEGERSRIAICAGNHDVCWNTALAAMEEVTDSNELNRLRHNDFYNPESQYRWNWSEKKAYKIVNKDLYDSRIDQYWDFIQDFYKDASLTFPINKRIGYSIFEIVKERVVVAAFNSVRGNDCFASHGSISTSEIADCSLRLRDAGKSYALKIGVWHHGIYTPPPNADYMSLDPLFDMANQGFGLGLHGHQHKAAHTVQYIHIPEQQRFPIVSAGSLCAGARELPIGQNRQYNIIEIADDYSSAKIYVRERVKGNVFTACMRPEFGINGAIDIELEPPDKRATLGGVNFADISEAHQIAGAERLLRSGDAKGAVETLADCNILGNEFARALFFEAALESESWQVLTALIHEPRTLGELSTFCEALSQLGQIDSAIATATAYPVTTPLENKMRDEVVNRLQMKKIVQK